MTTTKKYLYALLVLVISIVVINYGLRIWLEAKIPKIISEKTDYQIQFESLKVSLIFGNLTFKDVHFESKKTPSDSLDSSLSSKIPKLKVSGIKIFKLLFKDRISVSEVAITSPEIKYFKTTSIDTLAQKNKKPIDISIDKFVINNATIKYALKAENPKILQLENCSISLENILYNSDTSKNKIPIVYENISLTIDHLFYDLDFVYNIQSNSISYKNQKFAAENFEMIPKISRSEFLKQIPVEKDLYTLKSKQIVVKDIDWGYQNDDFYFKSSEVEFKNVDADIFRSKVPEDDTSKKHLYASLLRKIPFLVEIKKINIAESLVEYEEEIDRGEPGKLSFSNFNATIANLNSGFNKTELPDVEISVDCTFMHASKLKVDWNFNPLDTSDTFHIKGNLYNYPMQKTNTFLTPRVNVSAEGIAKQVAFNFTGNDQKSSGNFLIDYDDLKITIYKKGKVQENKTASLVANMFVRNSTKGQAKEVEITPVERKQDRSFFNFLWISVQQGLKQTLL